MLMSITLDMEKNILRNILSGYLFRLLPSRYDAFLQRWLVSDKDRELKEGVMKQCWNQLTDEAGKFDSKSSYLFPAQPRPTSHPWARIVAAVALLLVVGGVLLYMQPHQHSAARATCYVPYGEFRKLTLYDGTEVMLNSGSRLSYPLEDGEGARIVSLEGEAVFKVVHNAKHPFNVKAGHITIRDVGTCFNVRAYPRQDLITTVAEGRVELQSARLGRRLSLGPDEQAVFGSEGVFRAVRRKKSSKVLSWQEGCLVFEEDRLSDILATLERRFNVRFVVEESIDESEVFTMQFNSTETIDDVLRVLASMGKFRYVKHNGKIFLNERE